MMIPQYCKLNKVRHKPLDPDLKVLRLDARPEGFDFDP